MKNKKGQTIYSEPIYYPCEFRVRQPMGMMMCTLPVGIAHKTFCMPCILMGWCQDEVHIQWSHQSLQ